MQGGLSLAELQGISEETAHQRAVMKPRLPGASPTLGEPAQGPANHGPARRLGKAPWDSLLQLNVLTWKQ